MSEKEERAVQKTAPSAAISEFVPESARAPVSPVEFGTEIHNLPPALLQEILTKMGPVEDDEAEIRQMQKDGGLSSEEFLAFLDVEVPQQP